MSRLITLQPLISCPRSMRPGDRSHLVVDMHHVGDWPYSEPELPLTCMVSTKHFEHQPIGDQHLLLRQVGATPGPVVFRLTARNCLGEGTLTLSFVNRHGMTVHTLVIQIEILAAPAA